MRHSLRISNLLLAVIALSALMIGGVHAQDAPVEVGIAPDGQNAIEFIGRIDQSGFDLTSYGYITYLGGLPGDLLFAEGTNPMLRDQTAARFTFRATGTADGRSNYENIFAATTSASFSIYYNETPAAASFDNPDSFAAGTLVATFEGRLYSMLNVQEPNIGVLLVHSDTTQAAATPFMLSGASYQIGHTGVVSRFTIFGQGFRSSTEPLAASYHMAGDIVHLSQTAEG